MSLCHLVDALLIVMEICALLVISHEVDADKDTDESGRTEPECKDS